MLHRVASPEGLEGVGIPSLLLHSRYALHWIVYCPLQLWLSIDNDALRQHGSMSQDVHLRIVLHYAIQ